MKNLMAVCKSIFAGLMFAAIAPATNALTLTNPIVFVTQVQMPRENNGNVSNTFVSVVSPFGNHVADTEHAGRGGDLMLLTTNLGLVNLTRRAGFGTNGVQDGIGIGVRDPAIHWLGKKMIFSMVVGAPTNVNDATEFRWQLYEVTNLAAVIADTNTIPAIVKVPNQPTNYNNVNPTYATDDRIIFMTDRPFGGATNLYPQLEEYRGKPAVTGTYSLDPVSGNLRVLNHTPSGAFNPFVDSFGRVIETRWDHLVQDANATDDRLQRENNGAFTFSTEAANAVALPIVAESFPEPRNYDYTNRAATGVSGNAFNLFLPWMLPESGGEEEIINHIGRHEFTSVGMTNSFIADTNLTWFNTLAQRSAAGVTAANTNLFESIFQITEDPRTNGTYYGVDSPDFNPTAGMHTSGRIIGLVGPPSLNPNSMTVFYVTATGGGLNYRNPLPMSDGKLISAVTPVLGAGFDTNQGTATFPRSSHTYRLMLLTNSAASPFYFTNKFLITSQLSNNAVYWANGLRVNQTNALWELQPVEVRSRPVPAPWNPGVTSIEQTVFATANVDMKTFQADLANRGLALVVSRNVTARDGNDKQQPYNLRIPGGTNSIANSGKVYDITHLQFLQADYLRGYTNGPTGGPVPGRRVLATPMHDSAAFNYASSKTAAPIGGTELMPDGSQATIVPANRAVTWQLTGTNANDSVVKERYWVTFRPGEVRTCANCHGINAGDQLGRPAPTNAPLALQKLLQFWKTNSANAYTLTVSNGSGSGNFGAGSIVTLNANAAPSGKIFAGWSGAVSNVNATTTLFIMPTNSVTVTAVFTNLPPPVFGNFSFVTGPGSLTLAAQALPNQSWILQGSTNLLNWQDVGTNQSSSGGLVQFTNNIGGGAQKFFRIRSP
jgi:hypothetical protein